VRGLRLETLGLLEKSDSTTFLALKTDKPSWG